MPKMEITTKLLNERKQQMEKRKVVLSVLNPVLQGLVLGDFLELKYPKKRILRVDASYRAAIRLQEIFTHENPRPELLALFEETVLPKDEMKAFLLQRLEYQKATRKAMELVFSTLYLHVGDYINQYMQRRALNNVNDVIAFKPRHLLNWELSDKGIVAQIAYELESTDETVDYTVKLQESSFQRLFQNVMHYPSHPSFTKDALVLKIKTFLASNSANRRDQLVNGLNKQQLTLRSDSKFCKQFIDGEVCCDVDEVVATMKLSKEMFNFGHAAWSHNRLHFENELRKKVYVGKLPWIEACNALVCSKDFKQLCKNTPIRVRLDRYDRYDRYDRHHRYDGYDYDGYSSCGCSEYYGYSD